MYERRRKDKGCFDSWNKNWLLEWLPANDANHTRSLPHKSNFHLAVEKPNPISIFPRSLNNSWLPDRTADTLKQYVSFDVENLCPDPWASNCCFKRLTCFRFCRVCRITFLKLAKNRVTSDCPQNLAHRKLIDLAHYVRSSSLRGALSFTQRFFQIL